MLDIVRNKPSYARLIVGVAIIAAGLLFTLDNLGLVRVDDYGELINLLWPAIFVAIGVSAIVQARTWVGYGGGLVWLLIGAWLLGENFGVIPFSVWTLWPVFLIVLGGWIILNGSRMRAGLAGTADTGSFVNAVAVMSGVTRRPVTTDFRGGDLMAFMGGCKVDLREAAVASGEAQINVMAMWGGVEIIVPENWAVDVRVFPFMGGADDRTTPPTTPSDQRLVIRGLVIMGGVDVKNKSRS